MAYDRRPLAERMRTGFEQQENGCHVWTGYINKYGYGITSVKNVPRHAHRVAWEVANGPIADGLCVCHHCDNRGCINVDHLFLGTADDNMADMVAKGRASRGERNTKAKLTENEVAHIRSSSERPADLARRYGIRYRTIWQIRKRQTWKHVEEGRLVES